MTKLERDDVLHNIAAHTLYIRSELRGERSLRERPYLWELAREAHQLGIGKDAIRKAAAPISIPDSYLA